MRYLFGKAGRQCLQALALNRSLYAFDFDGTLARILRDRRAVRLSRPVRAQLGELSRWAPTVIISGRSLRDLRRHLDGSISYLIGNHGIEGAQASGAVTRRAQRVCAGWKRVIAGRFAAALRRAGVQVEDKTYSLAFHYRTSPRRRLAQDTIQAIVSGLRPQPRIVRGKAIVNAIPPGAPHKGEALVRLMARLGVERALFVGDDVTDEDVFKLADGRIVTVRVGRTRRSSARFFLKRQSEVGELLRALVAAHHRKVELLSARSTAAG